MRGSRSEKYARIHVGHRIALLVGLLLVVGQAKPSKALQVPPLRGRVTDLAALLSHEQSARLEEQLGRFEQETGHQIAVLTIPSLEGDALEDFSIRVGEAWKIGQKGLDNGVVLLVVRDDRKLRIEVGYGLEGVLPDAIASRIIREIIIPRFRDNDFGDGIEAGVDAIMKVTQGEKLPETAARSADNNNSNGIGNGFLLLALVLPVFISQLLVLRSRKRGLLIGGILGAGIGGLSAALGAFLGAHFSLLTILIVFAFAVLSGALGGLLGHFATLKTFGKAASTGWKEPFYSDPNDYRRGRWGGYGGVGTGSGGGSSGGGGSGFSGGGGGFGGGGASGGW